MPNTETTFIINLIKYMPDDKCEAYLLELLQSLPKHRLDRAIQLGLEVQAKRAGMPGGK